MSRRMVLFLSLALLAVTSSIALAQGPNYSISRWSFSSRGASSGGGYELSAIAGQPEVSTPLSGEGFTLVGGFSASSGAPVPVGDPLVPSVYLPLVVGGQ